MEIVKVENFAEMTNGNVYYELDGEFYQRCWNCGKPVAIDWHLTKSDLNRDDVIEEAFCDEKCEKEWFLSQYRTLDSAMVAGEEERIKKFWKFNITKAYVSCEYDDESSEHEAIAPAGELTVEELTAIARDYAKDTARVDSYFRTMTMKEEAYIQIFEDSVDISCTFTQGDFSADITVSFVFAR